MKVEVAVLGSSPVPNSLCGLCGRKATLNCSISELRSCEKVEVTVLGSPVPNSPYAHRACKSTTKEEEHARR